MSDADIREEIVKLLDRRGTMHMYQIGRALGLSYGAVQWHIEALARSGVVEVRKIGMRRYVRKVGGRMWDVYVGDLLKELEERLNGFKDVKLSELKEPERSIVMEIARLLLDEL